MGTAGWNLAGRAGNNFVGDFRSGGVLLRLAGIGWKTGPACGRGL